MESEPPKEEATQPSAEEGGEDKEETDPATTVPSPQPETTSAESKSPTMPSHASPEKVTTGGDASPKPASPEKNPALADPTATTTMPHVPTYSPYKGADTTTVQAPPSFKYQPASSISPQRSPPKPATSSPQRPSPMTTMGHYSAMPYLSQEHVPPPAPVLPPPQKKHKPPPAPPAEPPLRRTGRQRKPTARALASAEQEKEGIVEEDDDDTVDSFGGVGDYDSPHRAKKRGAVAYPPQHYGQPVQRPRTSFSPPPQAQGYYPMTDMPATGMTMDHRGMPTYAHAPAPQTMQPVAFTARPQMPGGYMPQEPDRNGRPMAPGQTYHPWGYLQDPQRDARGGLPPYTRGDQGF